MPEAPIPRRQLPPRAPAASAVDAGDASPDSAVAASAPRACPDDMVHIEKEFCTEMQRRCSKSEYDSSNHITICHEFEVGNQKCIGERIALDYCIDRYEFPNELGARPPVMVDWYDAMGSCAARGKRLCYESEWVAACEGPEEKPFPHGHTRDAKKCNIDNRWVTPELGLIYSKDKAKAQKELDRLDRSVPSGSMETCKSDYGVYDLTGNMDEWAIADRDRPKKKAVFAALKGGAWGHVRNACRPVTTSHEPEFRYYFVSFRCCKDPTGMAPFEGAVIVDD